MMLPLLPIILLIVALGSVFVYQKTAHEVTRVLAASSVIVCLVWGFAVAHWSIHLLCLLFLLKLRDPLGMLEAVRINK
jgi:hypothetical protein